MSDQLPPEGTGEGAEQGRRDVGIRGKWKQWKPTPILIDKLKVISIMVSLIGNVIYRALEVLRAL